MLKLVTCRDPNEAARNDVNLWNSGLYLWRTRGLRGLPARATLDGMATELHLPYVRVLEAALRDVGYLDTTDGLSGVLA